MYGVTNHPIHSAYVSHGIAVSIFIAHVMEGSMFIRILGEKYLVFNNVYSTHNFAV
jgi:hypothetical protein